MAIEKILYMDLKKDACLLCPRVRDIPDRKLLLGLNDSAGALMSREWCAVSCNVNIATKKLAPEAIAIHPQVHCHDPVSCTK
jgi:hypothetical protein